ncbi:hypothetical protein JHK82_041783 [Glycine max]|nr:hypothetical protein JHK86_041839 [Glycine max]KAG5104813.1 hypothetical protein JHK82_041783 [Glycine max]
MPCPHVAAAAVLLKAIHPTWSTAAIRSALMTTDNTDNPLTDETGNPATPFAMGSGHLNPKRAADAGLVFDASYMDYLLYTSNLGEYSITAIPNILKFNHVEQKMNLTITVTANWSQILTKLGPDKYYFGWYAWTHQHHVVRSSVAVSFP